MIEPNSKSLQPMSVQRTDEDNRLSYPEMEKNPVVILMLTVQRFALQQGEISALV
jgi:hypothetical protein